MTTWTPNTDLRHAEAALAAAGAQLTRVAALPAEIGARIRWPNGLVWARIGENEWLPEGDGIPNDLEQARATQWTAPSTHIANGSWTPEPAALTEPPVTEIEVHGFSFMPDELPAALGVALTVQGALSDEVRRLTIRLEQVSALVSEAEEFSGPVGRFADRLRALFLADDPNLAP